LAVKTIGEAYSLWMAVTARCGHSREDGPSSKSSRECIYRKELDMETLEWTRGRSFPVVTTGKSLAVPPVCAPGVDHGPQ
jgi:hypothetical protein